MAIEPIRKRFTLTFDVVQQSPMYEGDAYTEMTDEQLLAAMNRLFSIGLTKGYMIDWGDPLSCMHGPEENMKFIPEDTMLDIHPVSVEVADTYENNVSES